MSTNQEDQSKKINQNEGFQPGTTDGGDAQAPPQTQVPPQPAQQGQQAQGHEEDSDDETPLDYYEVLGLSHGATPARIERAYKNMALRYHPQNYLGSDRQANETRFAHLSEAYQVLSDPEKRRQYDEYIKKNHDKFRDFQNKHQAEIRQNRRNWRQLPVIHFRFHPYSPFNELFGYRPINPFDMFNQFLNQGMFEDEDLDFYGWGPRPISHGVFPRIRNDFFGDREIRDFIHGLEEDRRKPQIGAQHAQHAPQPQQAKEGKTQESAAPVEISRSVIKHTKIENGIRTTVTETKKVGADGHVEHMIKEETDDGRGHKRVRYLDALPELKKKEISDHQARTAPKEVADKKAPETKKE